ncbi:MAG: aromatic-ring-hydroxylating dioxygenase subunit beta [Candidatus Binataceae bacterium]
MTAAIRPAQGRAPDLRELEQFLFHQADLLDRRRWEEWMDLFHDDGVYWMPFKEDQEDAESYPSIFYEDKALMCARIGRLSDRNAWGQQPPTRTSHMIGNVRYTGIDAQSGDHVIRSRFMVTEFRRDVLRNFAGAYTHHLRLGSNSNFRIHLQRVDLLNCDGLHEYNIQVYV